MAMSQTPVPNVIVFGETGVGKSSILNMLDGDEPAKVSDSAVGVTFANTAYNKTIQGLPFKVFDTAGLNEAPGGTVDAQKAIEQLRNLIQQLTDGVSLLVYVMRAPRVKNSARQNYRMFFEGFCRKKVPIVIVITGLEEKQNMEEWWIENKPTFDKYKMAFSGFACVTATRGKLKGGAYTYGAEYEASKQRLEKLIIESRNPKPWKMSSKSWFAAAAGRMIDICGEMRLGFDHEALVNVLSRVLPSGVRSPDGSTTSVPNVIIFGETGAGKSSIINMLEGGNEANVSDQAKGVTFSSTPYEKLIRNSTFRIFDTAGLNEGSEGTVAARDAIEGLYQLIHELADGVNLLIYVMRAPRIKATAKANYELFFEIFCDKKVPIVVIITGLEVLDDMDQWWGNNKSVFDDYGMEFQRSACITSTRGKHGFYDAEYEESKWKVEELIYNTYSAESWKTEPAPWFTNVVIKLHNLLASVFPLQPKIAAEDLCRALRSYGGVSEMEAREKAREIQRRYGR